MKAARKYALKLGVGEARAWVTNANASIILDKQLFQQTADQIDHRILFRMFLI